jgi:DNA-directed RNA polymerase specialized sigma24 family protein
VDDRRDSPPPPDDKRLAPEVIREFIALPSTQRRIRQVIRARIPKEQRENLVEDTAQTVNLEALTGRWRPRDEADLRPGVSRIAASRAIDALRRLEVDTKWVNREADVEELPPDADESINPDVDIEADKWMLGPWLDKQIGSHSRDRQTMEILRARARDKTYEELAVDYQTTVVALKKRVQHFKEKYGLLRVRYVKRQRQRMILLILLGFAAVVVIAALIWKKTHDVSPPSPFVAPTNKPTPFPVNLDGKGVAHPAPERTVDAGGDAGGR